MATQKELHDFLRQHRLAWQFAWKALDDYLLARLGLLNVLWSGFEMATQACEKLLKAYILFRDNSISGNAEEVRKAVSRRSKASGRRTELGHDVEACLSLATDAGFPRSAEIESRLARINSYYSLRYPDSGGPSGKSTREILDVDEVIFEAWEAFRNINEDYYFTCGIMEPVYSLSVRNQGDPIDPIVKYRYAAMTNGNRAFEVRKGDIEEGIRSCLRTWYPSR